MSNGNISGRILTIIRTHAAAEVKPLGFIRGWFRGHINKNDKVMVVGIRRASFGIRTIFAFFLEDERMLHLRAAHRVNLRRNLSRRSR